MMELTTGFKYRDVYSDYCVSKSCRTRVKEQVLD